MGFFSEIQVDAEFQDEFTPIPDNTNAQAVVSEASWREFDGEEYISVAFTISDGPFNNRTVFQKLKVRNSDKKRRERAIRLLAAIDANCKGKIVAKNEEPNDFDLQQGLVLQGQMFIKIGHWKMDNGKEGNYVKAISKWDGEKAAAAAPAVDLDDDIPF